MQSNVILRNLLACCYFLGLTTALIEPSDAQQAPTGLAVAAPKARQSIFRPGSFPLSACKGWNGTITKINGIDSSHASMDGEVTQEDLREYCTRSPGSEVMNGDRNAIQKCVDERLSELKSTLPNGWQVFVSSDCKKGLLRSHREHLYQVASVTVVKSNFPDIVWRHVRTGELLEFSCGSGADVLTQQFKLLCPATLESTVSALVRSKQADKPDTAPSYVGRWFSEKGSECKGEEGETEGLLVYKPKELVGMENTCRISRATPKGAATELTMRCSGEGITSTQREIVEVMGGKLRRTVAVGRKMRTFTYSRCPE
jgi:hypothetical protein